jgi:hypothetical protein
MKNCRIFILSILLPANTLMAQELSHQVLVPMSGIIQTTAYEYAYATGEAVVELAETPDLTLTQGFQQPLMIFTNVIPPSGNGARVYPNPVANELNIELFGDAGRTFTIEIINIAGFVISRERVVFAEPFWRKWQQPVKEMSKGIYFVRIFSEDGLIKRTFKIDKM